jgi:hypothetical protein
MVQGKAKAKARQSKALEGFFVRVGAIIACFHTKKAG